MKEVRLDIQDEPRIYLDNYLLELVDEKDGIGNSLYLYGLETFVKGLWEDIASHNKFLKKDLLKELRIHASPFYAVMKGKRGISIQQLYKLVKIWQTICDKTDLEGENKWNDIYKSNFSIASFSKPIKVKLPKFMTPKLVYLVGWIVGDGCFDSAGNKERLKISEKSREQLEVVIKPIVEELFGINCYIRKDNPAPCLRIFSKAVYRFFRKALSITVGQIPEFVWALDKTNKSFFIRGLFDSEGDINANYLRSRVRISQNSKKFIEQTIALLNDVGIKSNGPYGPNYGSRNGVCYNLEIRRKSEILMFGQKVGTSHIEKSKRFEILSNEIKNKYTKFQNLGIQN